MAAAAQRRRWQAAWRGFSLGLLAGSILLLLVLALYKVLPLPLWTLAAAAGLAAAAIPAGFIAGWLRKPDLVETARWLDQQQNLKERLSTALEVARQPASEWGGLLARDAAQHLQGIDPRKLLPLHLSRAARWSLLALALAAGLGFVPEYRSPAFKQAQKDQQNIQDVGRRLAELAKRNLQAKPPALEPTQKSMDAVVELGSLLMKNPPSRGEALREVSKVADDLKKQTSELTQNPAIKKLDKAAREQTAAGGAQPGELQKKIEDLQNKLSDAAGKSDALDKLKDDLAKAKMEGKNLADKTSPGNEAARQKLAEALANMNQRAQNLGQPLQGLEDAIKALEAGNTDLFLKDLELATKDLDKIRDMAKALQQMQQQMGTKLGKDLAEQLKFGQAEAAIGTLEKMIEQLKKGNLTPAQLQELMKEVAEAVDPAGEYGECAKKLGDALKNMQQGQTAGAAQNLADAAKELEDLMKQMGDAQSLAAALDALERAQTAISTCQGMGQIMGNGPPRPGRGGKPGRGVGTWAEEEGWLYYPEQRGELWDNTGINMPAMDPRGHTERDTQKPDNLDPTKVRGQFSQGNSLPAITLKGVHIKGTSNVKFEEAAAAAQAEAQNALNQDQVPRPYRNNVKEYFDDLK